jgi:hypothetical protein
MSATEKPILTRRETLILGAAAAIGGVMTAADDARAEEAKGPTMHVYTDYAWLRGFSVVPSWGARIEEAWWNYDGARFREEAALAKAVNANCIRLWIEFTAWMADPEKVTERFLDAVKAIDEQGMKTMPCLFNRWHDHKFDYGGLYDENLAFDWKPRLDYVRAITKPLASDSRILVWDLCNEPHAFGLNEQWERREFEFFKAVADTVRAMGVRQPITVGAQYGANVELYAPLCDVICGHAYMQTTGELTKLLDSYHAIAKKYSKPFLVNECIPGALDDLRRAELVKFYSRLLSEAGFGWMGWALREGKAVSTRRDRFDDNGINGEGFHPFFTRQGKLRAGLDFLREPPPLLPPWQRKSSSSHQG